MLVLQPWQEKQTGWINTTVSGYVYVDKIAYTSHSIQTDLSHTHTIRSRSSTSQPTETGGFKTVTLSPLQSVSSPSICGLELLLTNIRQGPIKCTVLVLLGSGSIVSSSTIPCSQILVPHVSTYTKTTVSWSLKPWSSVKRMSHLFYSQEIHRV